jgi:hypothetical protein
MIRTGADGRLEHAAAQFENLIFYENSASKTVCGSVKFKERIRRIRRLQAICSLGATKTDDCWHGNDESEVAGMCEIAKLSNGISQKIHRIATCTKFLPSRLCDTILSKLWS